jgi:hypothetical protein
MHYMHHVACARRHARCVVACFFLFFRAYCCVLFMLACERERREHTHNLRYRARASAQVKPGSNTTLSISRLQASRPPARATIKGPSSAWSIWREGDGGERGERREREGRGRGGSQLPVPVYVCFLCLSNKQQGCTGWRQLTPASQCTRYIAHNTWALLDWCARLALGAWCPLAAAVAVAAAGSQAQQRRARSSRQQAASSCFF